MPIDEQVRAEFQRLHDRGLSDDEIARRTDTLKRSSAWGVRTGAHGISPDKARRVLDNLATSNRVLFIAGFEEVWVEPVTKREVSLLARHHSKGVGNFLSGRAGLEAFESSSIRIVVPDDPIDRELLEPFRLPPSSASDRAGETMRVRLNTDRANLRRYGEIGPTADSIFERGES